MPAVPVPPDYEWAYIEALESYWNYNSSQARPHAKIAGRKEIAPAGQHNASTLLL